MIRSCRLLVLVLVAILMSIALPPAQAGPAGPPIPRLVKVAGVLPGATGTVTVRFAIYAEQAGDTPLWAETQRVALDDGGRFAVYLGASQPDGLPVELFATGTARWLGVQADGQAEQPRVLLVSVPYALKAVDADTVGGKPLSAFVLAGATTGVGPDGLTYVDTRVLKQGLSGAGPLSQGAGTANYIGLFTDTTNLGNSVIYQNGTSIGVGTTSPAAAFHSVAAAAPGALFDVYSNALGALPVVYRAARGTPSAPSAVQTDDILGGLAVRGYGATGFTTGRGQVMFKAAENWTDSANGTYLQFTTTPIGSPTWSERMRIDPSGNVGIGTPTPSQKLSVAGTIESTSGGFKFPDGTTQASAVSLAANTFTGTQTINGGNLALPATTGATTGVLTLGGQSFLHAFGDATNTFVGGQAGGGFATTGTANAAFGAFSLYSNTTGGSNAAFGHGSLAANTTGASNAAFGTSSLYANTTGAFNAAFGYSSLNGNTTAAGNSAFGYSSLNGNSTGQYNTAVGFASLLATSTGQRNTGLGSSAGYYNAGGSYNTYIGDAAGPDAGHPTLSYATALGAGAEVTQSYTLVLGGAFGSVSQVNVGIGTSAPNATLQVVGDIRVGNGGTTGCVQNFAGTALTGTCNSDARLKTNIRPFEPVLDRVVRLQPVRFAWNVTQFPEYHFGPGFNSGLIAQDVERVFPEMVDVDERGYKMVNYSELPYLTLAAVRELKAENDALRGRVETADAAMRGRDEQIRTLTNRVLALEALQKELLAALARLEKRR